MKLTATNKICAKKLELTLINILISKIQRKKKDLTYPRTFLSGYLLLF